MDQEFTEFAYVVITPSPYHTMIRQGPGGQAEEIMYFKIGTQNAGWDSAEDDYKRANPNVWFRSMQLHWTGNSAAGAAGDLYGLDGPKQILQQIFNPNVNPQQAFHRLYPNQNTEWWYTTDANAIQRLRNLQGNWWEAWAPGAQMPNLLHGTVAAVFGDTGTRGPDFTRRFGAVEYFRRALGMPPQNGIL